jgi:uncharacterized protein YqgC (DUF456 family)
VAAFFVNIALFAVITMIVDKVSKNEGIKKRLGAKIVERSYASTGKMMKF